MGLTFLHPDTNESDFLCPISVLKHMRHLHYVHVGCCYWSYTDSRIFSIFQYRLLSKKQYRPFVPSFVSSLPFEVPRNQVSPSLFFAQLIAYRDAQFVCI